MSALLDAMHAINYAAPSPSSSGVRGAAIVTTEPARRARADIAASLARAFASSGVRAADLAASVGLGSGSVIERMAKGENPVSVEKLEVGSPRVALAFYRARAVALETSAEPAGLSPSLHCARLLSEAGDYARVVVEAGAEVDEAERGRLRRELHEVIEAATAALRDLDGAVGK